MLTQSGFSKSTLIRTDLDLGSHVGNSIDNCTARYQSVGVNLSVNGNKHINENITIYITRKMYLQCCQCNNNINTGQDTKFENIKIKIVTPFIIPCILL